MPVVPTIFALSSASGRAGVAVFRVSGPATGVVLDQIAPPRPRPRAAALREFVHPVTGERLDSGLALWFPAPASFTGEDIAELHTHGGRAVVAAMLAALGAIPECRLAEPGEFARRAFENGKLDLAEAEGLADLIDAETEAQRRHALHYADGAVSALYEGWRRALIDALALVEASIDFSDEGDVSASTIARAEEKVAALTVAIERHLDDRHRGEMLKAGFRVVIAGPPNAGKSSLLNALARRDVAIVSQEAGTTRDVIEVKLDLEGLPVILSDTAGIREASGMVEREGVRRAVERARDADLVLWMTEALAPPVPIPVDFAGGEGEWIEVSSKVDLVHVSEREQPFQGRDDGLAGWPPSPRERGEGRGEGPALGEAHVSAPHPNPLPVRTGRGDPSVITPLHNGLGNAPRARLAISTKTGFGLDTLIRALADTARERMGTGEEPAIAHARHREQLERAAGALRAFLRDNPDALELRAEDLRAASTALGRITGRVDPEEVLGQVFQRFCIGK